MTSIADYQKKMAQVEKNEKSGVKATDPHTTTKVRKTTKKPMPKTAPKKIKATPKSEEKATPKSDAKKAPTSALMDKYRTQLRNLQGSSGGGKFNFIKLKESRNTFRIVEPTNGPLAIFYKRQRGKSQGKFRTSVDLGWLVSNDDCLEAMLERDKLNDSDVSRVGKYGDPFDVLFQALNAQGRSQSFKEAGIGQKRSVFVVYKDKAFGILDMGITFGDNILDALDMNPDIISWDQGMDLIVKTTGEGLKTRYSPPMVDINSQGPLDIFTLEDDEEVVTPNLYDVLGSNVMHYPDKVQFLLNSYPNLVDEAGLAVEDFGISMRTITSSSKESFNFGKNKEEKEWDDEVDNQEEF